MKLVIWTILAAQLFLVSATWACSEDEVCTKDRVNFDRTYVGEVKEVLTDGSVQIKVDGKNSYLYRDIEDLAKARSCVENYCVGNRIIFEYTFFGALKMEIGTIVEIFDNGMAKIKEDYNSGYNYAYRNIEDLGKAYDCVEGICVGTRVVFDHAGIFVTKSTGTIVEIFDNGSARIRRDGYNSAYYRRTLKSLGLSETSCSIKAPCEGQNLPKDAE